MKSVLPVSRPRSLVVVLAAASILTIFGSAASAQDAPTAKSFEGVWRVTKVVTTGANAGTDTHPQPSIAIFYQGHYSVIRDNSNEPRKRSPAAKDPAHLTDAEKISRYEEWAPIAASGGTYEVKGNILITHNVVAKQVKGMTLTEEATIRFDGDSFIAGGPGSEKQFTYTRVR